jgi:porin
MNRIMRSAYIRATLVAAFFCLVAQAEAQETTLLPAASPDPGAAQPNQSPSPSPRPDLWHREQMTGDWGGNRTRWKDDNGVELELRLNNFYQGVADGGIQTGSALNAKFETLLKLDLGKLAGWKFWTSEIQTQTRFGDPLLTGTGSLSPVNTAALIPGAAGTVFSVTAVNFTRLIPKDLAKGNLFAVGFGRYNVLDLIDEDFFAGSGTQRFFNIAPIGPLTVVPAVPLITNGASFAYIKNGKPFITFAVMDPNDHSLDPGLKDLFADGVTFYPGIHFRPKYGGKTAEHSFGFAVTTKAITPFDSIRQIIIPGPPRVPVTPRRGSWSVAYTFRQYLVERGDRDGWGFFTQLSTAGKDTSPITAFVNIGLGGNGLFKSRGQDEFGIAYAYTDLSEVLKDNLDLLDLRRLRAEHQVELFYNLHITPWLRLTGDLQILCPTRPAATTAIVPGMRLELIF